MKRFKRAAVWLITTVLIFCLTACNGAVPNPGVKPGNKPGETLFDHMQGENDFMDDGIDRDFDFSDFDSSTSATIPDYESDTGTLVDHIFEAETLEIKSTQAEWGHACAAKSFHFDPEFGGNICLKNFGGNQFVLTVTCDKDVKVPVEMRISNQIGGEYIGADKTLGEYMAISTRCGKKRRNVKLDEVTFPEGGTPIANNGFFNMVEVSFEINLGNGINEIAFATQLGVPNWDYINIKTSATLGENTTVNNWFGDLAETKIDSPTQSKTGAITFVCKDISNNQGSSTTFTTLPTIPDGLSKGIYRQAEDATEGTYYLTVAGEKVTFSEPRQTLTFGTGAEQKVTVLGGEALPADVQTKIPAKFCIEGVPYMVYAADTFIMPFEDVTITAVENTSHTLTYNNNTYTLNGGDVLSETVKNVLPQKFYITNDLIWIFDKSTFLMPAMDIEIKAVADPTGTPIHNYYNGYNNYQAGGFTISECTNSVVLTENGSALAGNTYTFENSNNVANPTISIRHKFNAEGTNIDVSNATFRVTLQNKGTETVKICFTQAQFDAEYKYTQIDNTTSSYTPTFDLKAGDSKDFVFKFVNVPESMRQQPNASTMFWFYNCSALDVFKLGIAISYQA